MSYINTLKSYIIPICVGAAAVPTYSAFTNTSNDDLSNLSKGLITAGALLASKVACKASNWAWSKITSSDIAFRIYYPEHSYVLINLRNAGILEANRDALFAAFNAYPHHARDLAEGLVNLHNAGILEANRDAFLAAFYADPQKAWQLAQGLVELHNAGILEENRDAFLAAFNAHPEVASSLAGQLSQLHNAGILEENRNNIFATYILNPFNAIDLADQLLGIPQNINIADNAPYPFSEALDLIQNENQKNKLKSFTDRLMGVGFHGAAAMDKPITRAAMISDVTELAKMLVLLEDKESYHGEKELAWKEIEEGSSACGDRATLHLQCLTTMRLLHGVNDLGEARKIIVGDFRTKLIHEQIAKDFQNYGENIEVALWAQKKLHDPLNLPGNEPAIHYQYCADQAFVGKAETQGEYLEKLLFTILSSSDTPEKQVEILCDSPSWIALLKSKYPEEFETAEKLGQEMLNELDEKQSADDSTHLSGSNAAMDVYNGKVLVEKLTREFLNGTSQNGTIFLAI